MCVCACVCVCVCVRACMCVFCTASMCYITLRLTAGEDFMSLKMQLEFEPVNAQEPNCVNITTLNDNISEGTESFSVRLDSFAQGVIITLMSATVNILDDDG